MNIWFVSLLALLYFALPLVAVIIIIWLGVRYFDRRYKGEADHSKLLSGHFVKTNEMFRDPKDGMLYRVYYNPETGEREYVREGRNRPQ